MNEMVTIIAPVITAVIGSIFTYLVTRNNNNKDITVDANATINNGRISLSEDERLFRQELRQSMESYRDELTKVRKEVEILREINAQLELENQQLVRKVDSLTLEMIKLQQLTNVKPELDS